MPEAGPAIRLLQLTLKNIHGENGVFFLNAKGRLCATQRVTLTNVSEILQATNAVLGEYAKDQLAVFELGRVNGRETVAIGTLPKRKYVPNALTHVKAKYGLEDGFNPAQTRDLFFRKADTRYKK